MSEAKHTPGPWHVDTLGKVRCAAEDGKGFIADPGDGRYAGSIPRIETISLANARLIAAAPDLLNALREVSEVIHALRGFDDEDFADDKEPCDDLCRHPMCNEFGCIANKARYARAAIAKAEGASLKTAE